ncbi:MAG: hypothetical protein K1060chlam1_00257 [Candidatus Anoxychlamydiales bacterium]|nr:hypothetical protein [Candidatus Anoxychlamydiales bacterium]
MDPIAFINLELDVVPMIQQPSVSSSENNLQIPKFPMVTSFAPSAPSLEKELQLPNVPTHEPSAPSLKAKKTLLN